MYTTLYEFHGERLKPTGRNGWIKDVVKIHHTKRLTNKDIDQIVEMWHEDLECVRQVNPIHTTVTVEIERDSPLAQKYAKRFDYEVAKDEDGVWDLRNHSAKTFTPLYEREWWEDDE